MFSKLDLWINLSSIFLAAVLGLTILFFFRFLPNLLPLFYSLPWGERQLATHQQFLIIPATQTLITLANLIISNQLHPAQIFLKKALLSSSLLTAVILTVTFLKVIFIFI